MFRKLLVPLDRSPLAEQALGLASAIARASHAAIDLVLVHEPLPFAGFGDAPWYAEQIDDEHQYLASIAAEVASGASVTTTHAVMRGGTVDMICRRARDDDADLIVMTSHGRTGLSRAWLGSVADGVLRQSAVPVLLLRPLEGKSRRDSTQPLLKRLLVPLDGSALAADILQSVSSLARCDKARITLLRVVQPVPAIAFDVGMSFLYPPPIQDDAATDRLVNEAKDETAEVARRLRGERGLEVDAHVVVAPHVAQAIIDFAYDHAADAIAMSTHGRGASRLVFGSVADKVIRGSNLPMLLHRPIGIADPDARTETHVWMERPALTHA